MNVHVHLLPAHFQPAELRSGVAVMIDVLRASSTIVTALSNGASCVRPFAEVEQCREQALLTGGLTGGERGGVPLPGFDFGNSPSAYTPSCVAGREICFTTTNGTQALAQMHEAEEVLIGCFLNRTALVTLLQQRARDVHLVCAGTDGRVTSEDVLFAGEVAFDLLGSVTFESRAETQMATALYQHAQNSEGGLETAVRASTGGRNLAALGLSADISDVMQENRYQAVPVFTDGTITLG